MPKLLLSLLLLLSTVVGATAADVVPKTEEEKTLYTLGLAISRNLASFALTAAELEHVKAGLSDGVLNRPVKADLATYGPRVAELQRARQGALAAAEKKASEAFLAKAVTEKGANKTPSGLIISTITPGTGASPKATDSVKVHYHGSLIDGTVFDSSVQRGEPVTLTLDKVIRCWTEALPMMKVGGKSRLVCPSEIAYGDRGAPPRIKPGATLVFEVELLEIVK